ncbi:ribosomal protein S18-alanine N-acetyltransferase [Tsukamurella sp. 8F]|uniref:ribosomal protein S18-alanine N-acetyltransferase n=1 Tax=unclassified Tsukamurella TaxID=2633480 RepID=UPI0023B9C4B5|nr:MULTISPECIES: ribosomal protein S18-alanine N-acetyltransferase [unclassified Tsukamurella]MDF0531777.1 ribosomal protein S18-alanine N-acetyltransferase [Tsukamurella sp. 8J]MDF0588021.1 ribosomal protein S18-alanine N-acetyltransferase [Tsukamurella sp. 8F]
MADLTPLAEADADRCAELERILFAGDGPWPAKAFVSELAQPHVRFFAARDEGRLVGYAGIGLLGTRIAPESEIHTIGVDPAYQGDGVGRALLGALLAEADAHGGAVFLEVRTDNDRAIELYERAGFERVGLRRRYYRPSGADAYTMRRPALQEGDPA